MRSPSVKHRGRRRLRQEPPPVAPPHRPRYVGSPEHKRHVTPEWRSPQPRSDATACPVLDLATISQWLETAFDSGWVSSFEEGGFPRYAWFREEEQWFEARLTNQGLGEYKGYPIGPDDLPVELRRLQ